MEQLIAEIVKGLVEDKENINITKAEPDDEGVVVYHISVSPDDMGRVIGKQGRIAKAIRTVVRSAASRTGEKAVVEID
ncbi:MAG: KH domain-containing protein [Oscillospiraceae bacterium]|nr:KH domain-containing protein [Oscillospiraceae bacterium]